MEGALERTKGAKEMGDEEGDEDDRVHAADEDAEAREYEKQSKVHILINYYCYNI